MKPTKKKQQGNPDDKYWEYVDKIAEKYGVPKAVWEGLVGVESDRGRNPGVSSKGARGVWQIMPGTAAGLSKQGPQVNPNDPYSSAEGGLRILRDNYIRFRKYAQNDMHAWMMAVAGYQTNPNNVEEDLRRGNYGLPDWVSDGNLTPKDYSLRVMKNVTKDKLNRSPQGAQKFAAPSPLPAQDTPIDVNAPSFAMPPPVAPTREQSLQQLAGDTPRAFGAVSQEESLAQLSGEQMTPTTPKAPAKPLIQPESKVIAPTGDVEGAGANVQTLTPTTKVTTPPPSNERKTSQLVPNFTGEPMRPSQGIYEFERTGKTGELTYTRKETTEKGTRYFFTGRDKRDIYIADDDGSGIKDIKPIDDSFAYFQDDPNARWTKQPDNLS